MAGRRFGRSASSLRQRCGVLPASSVHASPKYNVLTQGNERVLEVGDQKGMPRASFPFGHYNTSGASGRTPVHIEIGKVEIQVLILVVVGKPGSTLHFLVCVGSERATTRNAAPPGGHT